MKFGQLILRRIVKIVAAIADCRHSPAVGKVLRLYGIGRVLESRGGIITFYYWQACA